jgi:hypothetical protein
LTEKARQDEDKNVSLSTELKHDEKDGEFMSSTSQDGATDKLSLSQQDIELTKNKKVVPPIEASPNIDAAFTSMSLEQTDNLADKDTDGGLEPNETLSSGSPHTSSSMEELAENFHKAVQPIEPIRNESSVNSFAMPTVVSYGNEIVFQPNELIAYEPTPLEDQLEEFDAMDNVLQPNGMIGSESTIGNASLDKQQDIECDNLSVGKDEEFKQDKLEPRTEEKREVKEQPIDNSDSLEMQTEPAKEVLLKKEKPKDRSHTMKLRQRETEEQPIKNTDSRGMQTEPAKEAWLKKDKPKERSHPMKLRQMSILKRDKNVKKRKEVLKRAALKTDLKEELGQRKKSKVEQDEGAQVSVSFNLLPEMDKMPLKKYLLVKDTPQKKPQPTKLHKRVATQDQEEDSTEIFERSAPETELPEKALKKKARMERKPVKKRNQQTKTSAKKISKKKIVKGKKKQKERKSRMSKNKAQRKQ